MGPKKMLEMKKMTDKYGGSITKKKDDRSEISGQNIIRGRTRNEYNRGLISFITCLVSSDIKKECLNTPGDFKEAWNNTDGLYKKNGERQ